jgi:probable F420-dependent oxidoreductase
VTLAVAPTVRPVKFGYLSMNPAAGIHPATLAVELEQRGFDSLWVPEHSHIPASRGTPYPAGGDLPSGYYHMMSPLVSLATAAAVTTDLVLATGITLILEHDVLDLACQTATLDVLSGGRLLLGVGVGWNVEELAHHRPDVPFNRRYAAGRERVAALRAAWGGGADEPVSFAGEWDRFEPSFVNPKPRRGRVPIAMGNAGPLGMRHAAEYGDEWCPINTSLIGEDGRMDVAGHIARFRELVASFGRDPEEVPISLLCFTRPKPPRLEEYATLGLARIVQAAPTPEVQPEADTRRLLDELTPIVADWAGA